MSKKPGRDRPKKRSGNTKAGGIFLSYSKDVESFVSEIAYCLRRQSRESPYFHPDERRAGDFVKKLESACSKHKYFVLFVSSGTSRSEYQHLELKWWWDSHNGNGSKMAVVCLNEQRLSRLRHSIFKEALRNSEIIQGPIGLETEDLRDAVDCARTVLKYLRIPVAPFDDLPIAVDEKYEKDIVERYLKHDKRLPATQVAQGFPPRWPKVWRHPDSSNSNSDEWDVNPLDQVHYGTHRNHEVLVDARVVPNGDADKSALSSRLTFPEAGPRAHIRSPKSRLKIGILVSGGIAPGINAVIGALVERQRLYEKEFKENRNEHHETEILAFLEGFKSLCQDVRLEPSKVATKNVEDNINNGGSVIPTARADDLLTQDPKERERLLERMVERLNHDEFDILYVIGGDGSMRATHALWTVYRDRYPNKRFSVVCVPKTMDNDILWVWQSFGFMSAVEKARQDIIQLHTEVSSNPRLAVMQLFGSASGYVVSHAALGSNVCDLVLIPEMEFEMRDVCAYMNERLTERRYDETTKAPYGLIVMAETAIPRDFEAYIDEPYVGLSELERTALLSFKDNGWRVVGQTPDELRTAGLKIVSGVLRQYINRVMGAGNPGDMGKHVKIERKVVPDSYWIGFRVFTNEPRHLIRSMEPSVTDVAYGIRLGTMAVDMAMAGYSDCMVSQWLTEYVAVPLKLVVLGRKRVPKKGIFWRTVVSKTKQMQYPSLT